MKYFCNDTKYFLLFPGRCLAPDGGGEARAVRGGRGGGVPRGVRRAGARGVRAREQPVPRPVRQIHGHGHT